MERNEAIGYLQRKGKIKGETKYSEGEEELIEKVEKEGKIFGDPLVELG